MPGTVTRVLPIAVVALLTVAACSNTTGGGSSPSSAASNAPYRAACKAEDSAHSQVDYILDGDLNAHNAYASLQGYKQQIDAAGTNNITGSDLWNDLNKESLEVVNLATDSDISASVAQGALDEFDTARKAVVADCESYGYIYADKTE